MNTIICNVNMFADSPIILNKDGITKIIGYFMPGEIHKVILAGCYQYNISEVKLSGNKQYISAITEDLKTLNSTEFNNKKKINIEVI